MEQSQEEKSENIDSISQRKESFASQEREEENEKKLEQRRREDAKSIFLENVDYKTTNQELKIIFEDCGLISRVTILKDPFSKQPKGCAYISFEQQSGVQNALHLTGLKHRSRIVKVHRKRTNIVGMSKATKGERNITFLNEMMKQFQQQGPLRGRGRGRGR